MYSYERMVISVVIVIWQFDVFEGSQIKSAPFIPAAANMVFHTNVLNTFNKILENEIFNNSTYIV